VVILLLDPRVQSQHAQLATAENLTGEIVSLETMSYLQRGCTATLALANRVSFQPDHQGGHSIAVHIPLDPVT
jgi:hypothetical protein